MEIVTEIIKQTFKFMVETLVIFILILIYYAPVMYQLEKKGRNDLLNIAFIGALVLGTF